jgi:uncharacterized protein (TIGR02145 family)
MAYYIDDRTDLENGKIINDSAEVLAPISPSYQYKTVTIGTQTWMAENLKETRFRDGTPIPNITAWDNTDWTNATVGAYCMLQDDNWDTVGTLNPLYGEFYGYLYNFEAAANGTADCTDTDYGGLAPEGWHVPTDAEWTTLEQTLFMGLAVADGGSALADRKDLWDPNGVPSILDSSDFGITGFNGLPAGNRLGTNGDYSGIAQVALFWSSSEHTGSDGIGRQLSYLDTDMYPFMADKERGFSVRCIKDT